MKRHINLLCVGLFALAMAGCNSADDKPSINQLLTNRSSKIWVNYSQKTNGVEQLSDCQQDDEWTFEMNGNIDIDPGIIRCSISEKDKKAGFLLAGSNNESFYYKYDEGNSGFVQTVRGRIVTLTETNFVFRFNLISKDGNSSFSIEYAFHTPDSD